MKPAREWLAEMPRDPKADSWDLQDFIRRVQRDALRAAVLSMCSMSESFSQASMGADARDGMEMAQRALGVVEATKDIIKLIEAT